MIFTEKSNIALGDKEYRVILKHAEWKYFIKNSPSSNMSDVKDNKYYQQISNCIFILVKYIVFVFSKSIAGVLLIPELSRIFSVLFIVAANKKV